MADLASVERGESTPPRRGPPRPPWLSWLLLRRIAEIAGTAAVVFVVYLALTYSTPPERITDVPAPGSAPDVVASGVVGSQSWEIVIRPSTYVRSPGQVCWFGHGPAFGFPASQYDDTEESCGKLHPPPASYPVPVQFDNFAQDTGIVEPQIALGLLAADVTSVVLKLVGGQQLKLIPVERYGYRLVAWVLPRTVGIASATAYLNNGRYATTIPVNYRGGLSVFPAWTWHAATRS
jgi:hypothetical protein